MKVWIQRVLRLVIGGIFIYASWDKIIQPDRLAEIIIGYQILPFALVNISAIWLPYLELLIGIFVVLGIWLRACSLLLIGLFILYIGAILFALVRNIPLVCGCFLVNSETFKTWGSLWQESLLLLGCILLWTMTQKDKGDRLAL
ncbi:DoxX family membrane protein [bacterium]|nr:DoxX family membrane protein [bacterium]MBU1599343.1 DoxX family membrane protein [bacterium]